MTVLARAIILAIPVSTVLIVSSMAYARSRSPSLLFSVCGSFCFMVVVWTHVAEAMSWLPAMGWGHPDGAGHYIDLVSAITGGVLLCGGVAFRSVRHLHH